MRKKITMNVWAFILLLLLSGLLFAVASSCGLIAFIHPTNTVIERWKQPDNICYNTNFGPVYLAVAEGGLDIENPLADIERRYYIYVGYDSGKLTYGHVLDYTFYPDNEDYNNMVAYIKKSTVAWSSDGVTFQDPDGHKLFIPKTMFHER